MPQPNLFKQYVNSESWKCPAGGSHYWVCMEEATPELKSKLLFTCIKCEEVREFYATYAAAVSATARKMKTTVGMLELQAHSAASTEANRLSSPTSKRKIRRLENCR